MTFELCVPAFNEALIIRESLSRVSAALDESGVNDWRIVVADNASTDGTGDHARALGDSRITVLRVEEKGKGAAILAVARAHQEEEGLFGFIDADLSADPADLPVFVSALVRDEADVIIGSRLLDETLVRRGVLRSISSRLFNLLRRALLGIKVVDSQCGLKVMNAKGRSVLETCTEQGWFLDLEFLAKAEREGLRIQEVPVHWDEQRFVGRDSKLRLLRDGVGAVGAMFRIRSRLT